MVKLLKKTDKRLWPKWLQASVTLFATLAVLNVLAFLWMWVEPNAAQHDALTNYNRAMYFLVTTLTTIGYGDITPSTNSARTFTMFVEISGVAFYGFLITRVSKALLESNVREARTAEKMDALKSLFNHYEVPPKLQKEVAHYYQHLLDHKADEEEEKILSELPPALQHEVKVYMNLKPLNKVELFRGCSVECLRDVSRSLEEMELAPGATLFYKGDEADGMYLISHGGIDIVVANNVVAHLEKGKCFGEMALIDKAPRNADARAAGYTSLYRLSQKRFDDLVQRHEDLRASVLLVHATREKIQAKAA